MREVVVNVKEWTGNKRGTRYYSYEAECAVCKCPLKDFHTGYATVTKPERNEEGRYIFVEVPKEKLGNDPAEWATAVGPTCGKLLPKTHRVTMKKACREYWKNPY